MVPSIYFILNQPLNFSGKLLLLTVPLGLYFLFFSLFKKTGKAYIFYFPMTFLHAFQIVLFFLFGEDVIASDMFLNVVTTNSSEIAELLGSLLPAIAAVCILYIPALIIAGIAWKKKTAFSPSTRKFLFRSALVLLILSFGLSFTGKNQSGRDFSFKDEIYPVNVWYNLGFAARKFRLVRKYPETSKNFSYKATLKNQDSMRRIIVLVVGETGRADSWELYGYPRDTNPQLKNTPNLTFFRDALTQVNVTHKSVPLILSSVDAEDFNDIYKRKGVFAAFKEAGYHTAAFSNQADNHSFIEYFMREADTFRTIRTTDPATQLTTNYPDGDLVQLMSDFIKKTPGNIFIVLHSYGSHFRYNERYPKDFARFKPDLIENVTKKAKPNLVNAYDNSILYTDYFLSQAIQNLETQKGESFLLYTSDHGEDIFDDDRNKFLHASPTPTYYQLRIPMIAWASSAFIAQNPQADKALQTNQNKAVSTDIVFHTLLDAGNIQSPYQKANRSVLNPRFEEKPRMYLNDHDEAVPYMRMNLKKEDFEMLRKNHIKE